MKKIISDWVNKNRPMKILSDWANGWQAHALPTALVALWVAYHNPPLKFSIPFFVIVSGFWFLRERDQQIGKGKPASPWKWSRTKHKEWIAPTLAAALVFV